tara:strand:+ start:13594 stop:17559 length:3966 start_codon:yes stop_codon:yes gene_type:complete
LAKKVLEQAYANSVKEDIGSVNFVNTHIHDPRIQQGNELRPFLKDLFQKHYGYDIDVKGIPLTATVLAVLAGPNASPESVDSPKSTTINTSTNPNPSIGKKGEKPLVRVIARVPELDASVNFPKSEADAIRLSSHGEYIAMSHDGKFDDIVVGSEIFVQLRTPTTSPVDGKHAGHIVGHIRKPLLKDLVKKLTSSKTPFRPECKADFSYAGPTPKFLTGRTDPKPSVQNPIIRKFKTRIKTGMYGNGSPQTKAHFNAAISKTDQAVKSFYYEIPGGAPDQNNSFIWVGHLRNNGYMDVLDRPINLGRETIIFAPMNLNIYAPIELKYYFHDRGGFGHAWIHGPNTTTEQAISSAALAKNDFRKKIGPAIKDMIRDKRNFILVIPEMAFSRGFGTHQANTARVKEMAKGKKVDADQGGLADLTMRTAINPNSRAVIKEYLRGLPAAELMIFEDSSWYTLGFEVLDTQTPVENLLQKTHLRERETVTFDGSFTGGKFGDFHQEVLNVISEYLSNDAKNNIAHTSIVADGLGGINLASIVKSMVLSAPHRAAEISFKGVGIDRIDYIESGLDLEGSYSFAHTPAYAIYEDYILQRVEKPSPFEFNYITDPSTNVGMEFFANLGVKSQFEEGNKSPGPKGEKKFSLPVGSNNSVISMHTVPKSNNEETHIKVGYCFSKPNNTEETGSPSLFIPETTSIMTPTIDPVPDHAATTGSPSEGKAIEYQTKQEEAALKINNIRGMIEGLKNKMKRCEAGEPAAIFCNKGKFSLTKFQPYYDSLIDGIKDWFYYKHMITEELVISKILNNKEALQEELNNPEAGVTVRLKDVENNNKSKEYFAGPDGIEDFADAIGDVSLGDSISSLKTEYTFHSAAARIRNAPFIVPYVRPGVNNLDSLVPEFPPASSDPPPGLFSNILERVAKEEALATTRDRLSAAIDKASPAETRPPVEGCEPAPYKIREFGTRVPSPRYFDPGSMRISELPCSGKDIRLVSTFDDLYHLIPWKPKKPFLISPGDRYSTTKTTLKEVGQENFQTKTFKYKARGRNNSVIYRTSPPVWSCIADRISSAWEAACNVSGYVPFRVTSGIKGFEKKDTGVTAYETGVAIDSFGLAINIDPPLTGYDGDGDALHSIFTGAWTPGFVDQYAGELYDLGVFDDGYLGPGDTFLDNAYQFYGYERRDANWWAYAEHEYDGPAGEGEKTQDYDKIMEPAAGSPLVPPGANPVLWLLTFCEKSGMRWGNSFFMKKRHRGTKTGWEIFGFDVLNDAPPFWSIAEQRRIAAIYGIPDVVARINAISWTPTSFDKHMHFQFYSGKPIIGWEEIEDKEGI